MVRAEKLASQADVDRAAPILGRNVFDAPGRTGNTGVVDDRVEPSERCPHLGEEAADVSLGGDISLSGESVLVRRPVVGNEVVGYVTDVDARAALGEEIADRAADAGGPGGDEHAEALGE